MENKYYLGLDIGTDSVGYAVTDPGYSLLKYHGEPMWGVHLFEGGKDSSERRAHRANRRRIDRRQQRVALLGELLADEIKQVDPMFFERRKESALFADDAQYDVKLFQGEGISDKEYHLQYPTIHHLILDLIKDPAPHDVRLVYLACAWLVAHRGHFLFDFTPDQIDRFLDFGKVCDELRDYFEIRGYALPWGSDVDNDVILNILQMDTGVRKKQEAFKMRIFGGQKISKEITEEFPYNKDAIVSLLCGGKVKPADLFGDEALLDMESVSLVMNDDDFDRIVAELGEEGELLCKLRGMQNCARLIITMQNKRPEDPICISSSKVWIYEQHKGDLEGLKRFVKKYCKNQYGNIFRKVVPGNYVAYSHNTKSVKDLGKFKTADKIAFSDYLTKLLKKVKVKKADAAFYEDMMSRLENRTFLPKQKDTDNRIIPQQLYRQELEAILKNAETYLPVLRQTDQNGLSVREKIMSIFDFRIPYYVGPLVKRPNSTAWIVRKQGKILPWNFESMVDLDASEKMFISKMTSDCTYLPGQKVLPLRSLFYEKFVVLNELNNIKVNGMPVDVAAKQTLFNELFLVHPRVKASQIRSTLLQHGFICAGDEVSGLDTTVKSSLRSYHIFRRMLDAGKLTTENVEQIIAHAAHTEDKSRMRRWILNEFPMLPEDDIKYILRQDLKGFGRLSEMLLCGLYGTEKDSDGEAFTIIDSMWNRNLNLMQLLSEKYTFIEQVRDYCTEYYSEHPKTLAERLGDMYVPSAVKRPIFRTLDIVSEVVKAKGKAPDKIFVEMARGAVPEQKGKRTKSRKEQLIELYKEVQTEDARALEKALLEMGEKADNKLQDRALFLYYLQLGKCMYTGKSIELSRLEDGAYNLDHIYPQSQVKDDSIWNNLVLVESGVNGAKSDTYPIAAEIRKKMHGYWAMLRDKKLITEEKYRRLTRMTPFTAEEKMGFINRQLVETRQSTKVVATLLKERYPDTQIIYVKAGMVSEFRQEYELPKSRAINVLHHAKDAYLNVVVGNVYDERFTKRWFRLDEDYNVQVGKIFKKVLRHGNNVYWNGEADVAHIKKVVAKNAIHLTRYAFFRKGGLFDQQPVRKAPGLIPLKAGMETEKYGGYNKPTACGYLLLRFVEKKSAEIMFVPVDLLYRDKVQTDPEFALA